MGPRVAQNSASWEEGDPPSESQLSPPHISTGFASKPQFSSQLWDLSISYLVSLSLGFHISKIGILSPSSRC